MKNVIGISMLLLAIFFFGGCSGASDGVSEKASSEPDDALVETPSEDPGLTPEEVLARMDAEEGVGADPGNVEVSIVSPEGEVFSQGQARMYDAKIENLPQGFSCLCHWKFYLNEYAEEVLYKEMDIPCTATGCGFTSTFIENRGDLRVKLDLDIINFGKEKVREISTERKYQVQ